ncbi:hypothetical protein SAMN02910292_01173 [Lachnospiraceae bacterium XBB2008]|nr:hypothetical protein SAMN02910292_01173 [Lachnospiraceae bacterium XBB2008]
MKTIKTVNMIGLGALGMLYGKNLTDASALEDMAQSEEGHIYCCGANSCSMSA